jgi:hypothetical protein
MGAFTKAPGNKGNTMEKARWVRCVERSNLGSNRNSYGTTLILFVVPMIVLEQCCWSDGRIYKGDWVNGKAHGYGKEIRPDGSIRHDGKWDNDKPIS